MTEQVSSDSRVCCSNPAKDLKQHAVINKYKVLGTIKKFMRWLSTIKWFHSFENLFLSSSSGLSCTTLCKNVVQMDKASKKLEIDK